MRFSRAGDLFEQVTRLGIAYFNELIASNTGETEILDFKQLANARAPLTPDDKKNWSKAIGGFANADGGLLIWGVDCRQGADGVDRVQELKPISNLKKVESDLRILSSQLVSPGVSKIEIRAITLKPESDDGFLVCFIPKGEREPIMSTAAGLQKYYYRIGNDFQEMTHSMIADRFLRRPQACLELVLEVRSKTQINDYEDNIGFVLGLLNTGSGAANSPGVFVRANHQLTLCPYGPAAPQPVAHMMPSERGLREDNTSMFFAGSAEHVIYPETICYFAHGVIKQSNLCEPGMAFKDCKPLSYSYKAYSGSSSQQGSLSVAFSELLEAEMKTVFNAKVED